MDGSNRHLLGAMRLAAIDRRQLSGPVRLIVAAMAGRERDAFSRAKKERLVTRDSRSRWGEAVWPEPGAALPAPGP